MTDKHSRTCINQCGKCRRMNPDSCLKVDQNVGPDSTYLEWLEREKVRAEDDATGKTVIKRFTSWGDEEVRLTVTSWGDGEVRHAR